jgi:hypothetical protein
MRRFLLNIIFILSFCVNIFAQEAAKVPERSAEQEATVQTEKLQKELDLDEKQTQEVYEINLRYARERQKSNTRTEAVERIKNKEDDMRKVLTDDQFQHLQDKRSEVSTSRSGSTPTPPPTSTGLRQNEQQKPEVSTQRRTTQQRTPEESRQQGTSTSEQSTATRENRQAQSAQPTRQNPNAEKVNRPENQNSAPARRSSTGTIQSYPRSSSSSAQPANNNRR